MKLYERIGHLSQWLRFEATYLEMKYHLKQVMKGKKNLYFKYISRFDRNIGKSVALARLSAKYGIPVVVPTNTWKITIERDIPKCLPRYFKKKKPFAIVEKDVPEIRGSRYDVILAEERLLYHVLEIAADISNGKVVGYWYC